MAGSSVPLTPRRTGRNPVSDPPSALKSVPSSRPNAKRTRGSSGPASPTLEAPAISGVLSTPLDGNQLNSGQKTRRGRGRPPGARALKRKAESEAGDDSHSTPAATENVKQNRGITARTRTTPAKPTKSARDTTPLASSRPQGEALEPVKEATVEPDVEEGPSRNADTASSSSSSSSEEDEEVEGASPGRGRGGRGGRGRSRGRGGRGRGRPRKRGRTPPSLAG